MLNLTRDRVSRLLLVWCLASHWSWSSLSSSPDLIAAEPLRVGIAEADITPPVGFPMAGYYHERLATGVIDPLKAKAVVFRAGETQAAWVVCDLTGIAHDLTVAIRTSAAAKTGIPPESITITATHSHTAPDYYRDLYQVLNDDPRSPERLEYITKLIEGPVDAIVRAHKSAAAVELSTGGIIQQTPVAFNRRFVMRDGSVRTWMKNDSPGVVRAAGPTDPEIGLVKITSLDGSRPLGVLSNFALHLDTVGGLQWSADYPFYIEQAVRKSLGSNVVSLFGAGTCGDINHTDPNKAERNKTEYIGQSLGQTIAGGVNQLTPLKRQDLHVGMRVVSLPLETFTPEQLAQSEKILAAVDRNEKVDFFDHVLAHKRALIDQFVHQTPLTKPELLASRRLTKSWAGVGPALPVEVHVICIGDELAIVTLPGEVFVDLGLAIKRGSPFRTTLVVELANCVETIYIPHRAAYAGGSYEVTNSAVQPGSGEMLVEAALSLLREAATAAQKTE